MILIIDNYDSFSYNLYQVIGEFNPDIKVIKNDELNVTAIDTLSPSHIVLSPGPSRPENAGVCLEVIQRLHTKYPILGVCLGHQSICQAFGATITYAKDVLHGKQSYVTYEDSTILADIEQPMLVARYHSLAADISTMPEVLKITATTDDGEVMAVEHKQYPVYGVQFHPESILTPQGKMIIQNFLETKPVDSEQQKGGTQMIKDASFFAGVNYVFIT